MNTFDENNDKNSESTLKLAKALRESLDSPAAPQKAAQEQDKEPKTMTAKLEKPEVYPAIPIKEGVLFPSTESVLTFGRQLSVNAIDAARKTNNYVVLLTQKSSSTEAPTADQMYGVGTLAIIEKTIKTDGAINALVRGMGRVKVTQIISLSPTIKVEVEHIPDIEAHDEEATALVSHLQKEFRKAVHLGKPVEFLNFMKLMGGVTNGELVDQIASTLGITSTEKQQLLEVFDVKERMKIVLAHLARELKVLEIEKDVVAKTQEKFDKNMRENVLRERLRTIQKELGEVDDDEEIVGDYMAKLKKAKFPPEIKKKVQKEIRRLHQMSTNNPEAGYVRTWIDTMFELPWGKFSPDKSSLESAEKILNTHHFGLEKVKERILEYLAVLQLKQQNATKKEHAHLPTIICFVGPPGVGKTSIGKSIATALGRKFVKVSLGGVHDEAEIRGHRRTYVGAMPGKIINGIKQAESMNPVFMLDEIDKIGSDHRGDPSAALLEALDPEQNKEFEDHYIDAKFDLSNVIFITTANVLDTIPHALKDRLEIIRYSGYTNTEKFHIAKDHLFKKVMEANGILKKNISFGDEIFTLLIERYTREAGVRSLEKKLSTIMRKVAKTILTEKKSSVKVTPELIQKYLGPEEYDITLKEKDNSVGVATGLAWTSVGGDVLFIEVALTPGKGLVKITGQLGDVMKESAQAAMTFMKSHSKELGISDKKIKETDIHIHVPEGAVPKDGPSAGVTMTTAIVSAFTKIPVKKDVAMTGEVTLRGNVLRIGGLKEKSIAAQRAGITTVLIPKENARDLVEIPAEIKKSVKFIPVEHVSENLKIALIKDPFAKAKG